MTYEYESGPLRLTLETTPAMAFRDTKRLVRLSVQRHPIWVTMEEIRRLGRMIDYTIEQYSPFAAVFGYDTSDSASIGKLERKWTFEALGDGIHMWVKRTLSDYGGMTESALLGRYDTEHVTGVKAWVDELPPALDRVPDDYFNVDEQYGKWIFDHISTPRCYTPRASHEYLDHGWEAIKDHTCKRLS